MGRGSFPWNMNGCCSCIKAPGPQSLLCGDDGRVEDWGPFFLDLGLLSFPSRACACYRMEGATLWDRETWYIGLKNCDNSTTSLFWFLGGEISPKHARSFTPHLILSSQG